MKTVKVGILGLGTVGAGTAKLLQMNQEAIESKTGALIFPAMASLRNTQAERGCDTSSIQLSQDSEHIVRQQDIDIVVETIGGTGAANSLIITALKNRKHVVTANKALIAEHGESLFALAEECGVSLRYEAAVAGGIPVIKDLREGLAANKIHCIMGIINGTSNFILSEMREKGLQFDDVLAEAQQLGYAEADPTFDIEGIDAAHKLTIMASIAFGIPLSFGQVFTQGISHLSIRDMAYAEQLGYRIKHLGIARWNADKNSIELRVHPTMIPKSALLAKVEGVLNAVSIESDALGASLHCGAGAGALPTASSIVADIIDIVRENTTPHYGRLSEYVKPLAIAAQSEFECAFYVRISVKDMPGVMSEVTGVFAQQNVNIEAITQEEPQENENAVSVIFLTQITREQAMQNVLCELSSMGIFQQEPVVIRVEQI